jgi:small subunit ribosomal protein S21
MSKKPINVEVEASHRDENPERLIRRFVKKVKKERILENYRDRMYYEKPSVKRKRKQARRKKVLQKLRVEKENKEKIN